MVKSLIINLRVYKYRVYLFSNFHLISSCTIETKVISTFLRIFSVQKIENSFVVLITRLTCQSSSRKIYENFTYIVYVYIYIYWKRQVLPGKIYPHVEYSMCVGSSGCYEFLVRAMLHVAVLWLSIFEMEDAKRFPCSPMADANDPPPTPPIRTLFSLEFSVFRLIFV